MGITKSNRLILLLLTSFLTLPFSYGQIFREIPRRDPDLFGGDLAVGDIDNDGDADLIFVQGNASQENYSPILLNNGNGGFSEKFHKDIYRFWTGSVELIDFDRDGDLDAYLQGQLFQAGSRDFSAFFINDGKGNFSEKLTIDIGWRSVFGYTLFDADGDQDPDLLISYTNQERELMSTLLLNQQTSFEIAENQPFGPGNEEDFITGDMDRDQDIDVITRENNELIYYVNDGQGNFSKNTTGLMVANSINMGLGDLDGANGLDLLITGNDIFNDDNTTVQLYLNEGDGNLISAQSNLFAGSRLNQFQMADLNSDGRLDLAMIGDTTRIYLNQGNLEFDEITNPTNFDPILIGQIELADLNGDNTLDIVATGSGTGNQVALHFNDGTGNFENRNVGSNLIGAWAGSAEFVDLDGDLDLDMTISGVVHSTVDPLNPIVHNTYATRIYFNQGNGDYTASEQTDIDGTDRNEQAFADIDGDGDLDWLLSGWGEQGEITLLLENDGFGEFQRKSTNIMPTRNGFAHFEDLDADGDPDLFLMGLTSRSVCGTDYCAIIYTNDGSGNFFEHQILNAGVNGGSAIFLDLEMDGDKDLYITGNNFSAIFFNDGSNTYSRNIDVSIPPGFIQTTMSTDDLNEDGIPDLKILGEMNSMVFYNFYLNDGLGNFSLSKSVSIEDNPFRLTAGDVNEDGHEDFILTGFQSGAGNDIPSLRYYTHLYLNNGQDEFTLDADTPLRPTAFAGASLGDIDFDGDLDMVLIGNNERGITTLYENTTIDNPGMNPVILTPIEDQQITIGDGPLSLDVAANFDDADGDVLSFQVSGFDASLISIAVNGTTLEIEALAPGTSQVVVEANDGNEGKVFDQFKIIVEEAPLSVGPSNKIRLFPIPLEDILRMQTVNQRNSLESVSVINLSGKLIMTQSYNAEEEKTLNLGALRAGIYVIRLQLRGQSPISRKVIKK